MDGGILKRERPVHPDKAPKRRLGGVVIQRCDVVSFRPAVTAISIALALFGVELDTVVPAARLQLPLYQRLRGFNGGFEIIAFPVFS